MFLEASEGGEVLYLLLGDEAEGTDERDGVVLEGEDGGDGGERALEGHVHEEGVDDVVLMMTESHFVESVG